MGISIIRGAISSGKSTLCLDQIEKVHNQNPKSRCIMIVPDHYSYETERTFVEKFGGTGLNSIEVLTLRQMAINGLSAAQLNHLTESGRQMLIHKAVTAACEILCDAEGMDMKLIGAMRRRGFLDVASSLISELKRYLIPPELLREKADALTNNLTLKNKLTALSCVYENYLQYVEASGFTDSEDDLYALAKRIEEKDEFNSDTYVWVNGFDTFMPQQLAVMEALLKKSVHMTFSICCSAAKDSTERELYVRTEKTVDTVMNLASVYGLEGEYEAGEGLSHIKDKDDLYTLFRFWNEDFVYEKVPQNIAIFQSRDAYGEVERIACKIVDLVREEGYRFRDIAMICGDDENYSHLVEAVFGEYEIPYFTDRKIILSNHPIAMQIISLFSLLEEDWSYDAVFRYLRAGFIYRKNEKGKDSFVSIEQEEVDELENFVLRCGIRGASSWLGENEWTDVDDIVKTAFGTEEDAEKNEKIEALRREITAPVERFAKSVKGEKTAKEFAEALFSYLEDINMYNGLKGDIKSFREKGMLNEAEQFAKIWNLILDVLNQTTVALSNDKMKIDEFAQYMEVGLSKCEIRIIPSGIDRVYFGSVERSSRAAVKVMFVAGAKNNTFPTAVRAEGFLSDKDRNTLDEEYGIKIAPDTKKKTDEQYFKVYRALCAVSEKLFFSYSVQDEEGAPLSPSHMIVDLRRKFPRIKISDNLLSDPSKDGVYISSPKATIHRMLVNLSKRRSGQKNPLWDFVREWCSERKEWKKKISLMDRADYYDRRSIMLDSEIASMLYDGRIVYSASRINTFARCPFEYFLKYGLEARERKEWEITPANMGTYAHQIIHDFCKTVESEAAADAEKIDAWRNLDDKRRDEILASIIDAACENILSADVRDKERTAAIFKRMGKTVSQSAKLVQKSLSSGSYAQAGMEYKFEVDITENIAVRGIIDRMDMCGSEGGSYMRIIDYKTGKTEFDVVNIVNGYDMQMVLYALCAAKLMRESGKDVDVTGIYYTAVRDEYKTLSTRVTEENIRKNKEDSLVLDGVTFAADNEEERSRTLYCMDNGFFENRTCGFAKIKLEEDGTVKKLRSLDEINGLMEHVRGEIEEMDKSTRSGVIAPKPYTPNKGKSVCEYCDYIAVCKFDDDKKEERKPEMPSGGAEEIWDAMKVKGAVKKR